MHRRGTKGRAISSKRGIASTVYQVSDTDANAWLNAAGIVRAIDNTFRQNLDDLFTQWKADSTFTLIKRLKFAHGSMNAAAVDAITLGTLTTFTSGTQMGAFGIDLVSNQYGDIGETISAVSGITTTSGGVIVKFQGGNVNTTVAGCNDGTNYFQLDQGSAAP